ncbi:MAG: hypothetical protein WD069_09770 [Planctomycetales bacterium]
MADDSTGVADELQLPFRAMLGRHVAGREDDAGGLSGFVEERRSGQRKVDLPGRVVRRVNDVSGRRVSIERRPQKFIHPTVSLLIE